MKEIHSTKSEIVEMVKKANKIKSYWNDIGLKARLVYLNKLYNEFSKNRNEIALLITKEIGKPISQTLSEFDFFHKYNRWFLNNAEKILAEEITYKDDNSTHKIVYEPTGTVAAIIPWNSPFGLFCWKVLPNLIVGNVIIIKPSEESTVIGKLLETITKNSKLPEGVFGQIYGDGNVGQILTQQKIDMICFTGSSKVGKLIYEQAGKKFIKSVMELGGSNPAIVFEDTDIDKTAERIFWGRFANNGQNCDAIKRLIVHKDIARKIISKLTDILKTKIIGNPENPKTYFGPLVSFKQQVLAKKQLEDALEKGAKIEAKIEIPKHFKGAYFSPIILSDIKRNMTIWYEEVFAPILPIVVFTNEEEAIALANDTPYGLGATVFTKNKERFGKVASKIKAANIEMNNISQWIPENPFGGLKGSGIGRENGAVGLKELCQIKVVSLEK